MRRATRCSICKTDDGSLNKVTLDGKLTTLCLHCLGQFRECFFGGCRIKTKGHQVTVGNGEQVWVCLKHFCQEGITCANCGRRTLISVAPAAQSGICPKCCPIIKDYNYKLPFPDYQTKNEVFFGVELEVSAEYTAYPNKEESAKKVAELMGDFAVIKSDCTTGPYGFEIVSKAATLQNTKAGWHHFFKWRPNELLSWDAQQGTCGLHIHCSKAPLTKLVQNKLVNFMNKEKNRRFLVALGGRESSYATFNKNYVGTKALEMCAGVRRVALNLCPQDTIEFRLFRGTLYEPSFFKALEFCDALIKFAQYAPIPAIRWLDPDYSLQQEFIATVLAGKKEWPNLALWISRKWLDKLPTFVEETQERTTTQCA